LVVEGMVSIFTYGFPEAVKAFEMAQIPYYSLTNYLSLLEKATNSGLVSPDQHEILLKWRDDPANWKGVR
jgi:orotate phosphoribosyltransferase